MTTLSRRSALALGSGALFVPSALRAQAAWPTQPLSFVVGYAAGGGADIVARELAHLMTPLLGQQVIVENKGGAAGFIAAQYVAKAAPDGYTLLTTTNTTQSANEHLFKKLPYDPVKDFAPITLVSTGQMLLLVRPDSPYKTLADLIAAAKKAPGKLSFGAGSSSSQVASELLKQMAHVDALYVPYKSNPLALTDLIGGQIDFMFADAPTALPQVQGGKLRALAITSAERAPALPEVPTLHELLGSKLAVQEAWSGLWAPARTPPEVVQRLQQEVAKALASPAVKERLLAQGAIPGGNSSADFVRMIDSEHRKWAQVVKAAGAKVD